MKKIFFVLFLTGLLILPFGKIKAQDVIGDPPLTRILFIFDGSQSMLAKWESDTKINIAKKLLNELIDSLKNVENLEVALRVYGHQKPVPPQDCNDTKLEVPFGKNNFDKIKQRLWAVDPKGTTPIARSLELGGHDFPYCSNCRNIIILITDGIEACDGDPCAVSQALQAKGVVLKPFVIGVGLDLNFKKTFECVGDYYDAANETKFKEVLGVVISQALNNTTLQVNLLDIDGNPTETDVNMTFYDRNTGKIKYNFIHTINAKGVPDTLILDPFITYRMVAHTIPPVYIDSIKLTPGKHTITGTDAPQGYLIVKGNSIQHKDVNFIVRKAGKMQTLNVQKVENTEKYIVGKYDIEILTLPRLNISDVEIKQSHTTTVQIPQPGMVTFMMDAIGYGSLYIEKDNKLEWIYNLNPNTTRETLTLLPGNYRVIFRGKNVRKSIYTIEKSFKVVSGTSIPLFVK